VQSAQRSGDSWRSGYGRFHAWFLAGPPSHHAGPLAEYLSPASKCVK
jgi:hypothetical protein